MAREVIEKLIDDLDGSAAVETVTFALDGTDYEIDLSKKNASAFRKSLGRFIAVARREGRSPTAPPRRPSKPAAKATKARVRKAAQPKRDFDLVQLREWAGANGVDVPSRGRIPQSVVEQYKAAGGR